jgi:folate-binding protein YgfZ
MNMQIEADGLVPLPHWGLIRVRGADAVKFLQGQLTNDVATMSPNDVRLAGFCSAKGRLQASFIVWKVAQDELLLACSASLLAPTLKRLSMFVLRAQCKLSDASAELTVFGAVGRSAQGLVGDTAVMHTRPLEGADHGTVVRLHDVHGMARCMLVLDANSPRESLTNLPALSLPAWQRLEVESGVPIIEAATFEKFVPQMLNYELVGGVDFQKGCYPGQEIVARSQYRGTIKRRMFLFSVDAAASAGQEVFHSEDASQPAGMVVNSAPSDSGSGSIALVETKLAAIDNGSLHLGAPDGPILHLGALPYAVPTEAAQPA